MDAILARINGGGEWVFDALLVGGALGLVSSLFGHWFFYVPVVINNKVDIWSPWSQVPYVTGGWSNVEVSLKAWLFYVFNFTEKDAGLAGNADFTWFTGSQWADWKWGDPDPSGTSGQTTEYGLLGPYFGWICVGSVALGAMGRALFAL